MNSVKTLGFFAAGFLAVLLTGCFNPITVVPSNTADNSPAEPFFVDILIGKDTARSVAGPDAARIKGDIRNIIQLIVIDESGKIVAFKEARRGSDTEKAAELRIESIPLGETYNFLLLMGHWERDYAAENNGEYTYTAGPPTLLAAGFKEQTVTGSGTVTVTMWPLVVDTVFTVPGNRTAVPEIKSGKPEKVILLPLNWDVTWTIKRGLSKIGDGLADLITAQQKIPAFKNENDLQLRSTQTMVRQGDEDRPWTDATLNGNVITLSMGAYTDGFTKIGTRGSVNFKMEYVPFNLTDVSAWSGVNETDTAFNISAGGPVWIIRNGVNDEAQDVKTDFNSFHHPDLKENETLATEGANGNGAVRFSVAVKTPAGGSNLVIKDGVFVGPSDPEEPNKPDITFTTEGYTGVADVYYTVVEKAKDGEEQKAPDYSNYVLLDTVPKGDQRETVTVRPNNGNYDIYVIIYKDGEVSEALVIDTAAGGGSVDWNWGDDPYKKFYVKSGGDDGDPGTRDRPLATVGEALTRLAAAYTSPEWPEKGTELESPGAIIILDEVKVTQMIIVDDTDSIYPPIVLCDDPETPGGTLKAMGSIGEEKRLLNIRNGAKVTLTGGLVLSGTGNTEDHFSGVYVTDSTFTITGGEISGYFHGIYARDGGTVIMTGGKILDNSSEDYAGGVVASNFIMYGGEISNNKSHHYGGGVYVDDNFTMTGGKISKNTVTGGDTGESYGGGVMGGNDLQTFTMTGGEISRNSACYGGGVYINNSGVIIKKSGGVIYGYDDENPANSNIAKYSDMVFINQGHAVYLSDGHRKETTVGPEDNLYYNYPNTGDMTDWDDDD
ncbi:MAG: right-handed parallel beta-helix repeat-containing protein [Treponema sp.]|jgi:hypothetical protein|nr:right-handed parallel beta-helix repeat-containing protein [Treponema sp.]